MNKITMKGFKSFMNLEDFELKRFNILIGNCGSGKSNFLSAFRLLKTEGVDNLPHFNSKSLEFKFLKGGKTCRIKMSFEKDSIDVLRNVKSWKFLNDDPLEISYLYSLAINHTQEYKTLVDSVYSAFPYLYNGSSPVDLLELKYYQFSSGLWRFIKVASFLLEPASLIVLDGPEAGLDPTAIGVLSELIKTTSEKTQFVMSTHSPEFINQFNAEDLILVKLENGSSTLTRLNEEKISQWLEHYSLGELWVKGVLSNYVK